MLNKGLHAHMVTICFTEAMSDVTCCECCVFFQLKYYIKSDFQMVFVRLHEMNRVLKNATGEEININYVQQTIKENKKWAS